MRYSGSVLTDNSRSRRPQGLLRWPTYALGQLHGFARSRVDTALHEKGLSVRVYFVLACLAEYGEMFQQQVADRIAVDRSDLVKLIDQLEECKQVVRRPDTSDRRRHVLSLTPKGKRDLQRSERIIEHVTREVLSRLTLDERRTLHRLTLQALGEHTGIADSSQ